MPSLRTAFLWSMIASFLAAAAMGVFAIMFDGGRSAERIMVTSLLVGAFSFTALGGAITLDRHRVPVIGWTAIAASVLALGFWCILIWGDLYQLRIKYRYDWEEIVVRVGTVLTCTAVWSALGGVLGVLPLQRSLGRTTRLLTVIAAGCLGASVSLVVCFEEFEPWTGKLLGVLSVLSVCGTVVTPLLAIVERVRLQGQPESIARRVKVNLECPRCAETQPVPTGRSRCRQCGLRMRVEVEEPRCRCGYLLYRLEGTTCPECGCEVEWKHS